MSDPTRSGGTTERPRVALVGAGDWGKNLVRNFDAIGALAAVCETRPQAIASLGISPNIAVYADYDDVLASDVDAVAIATPAASHESLVRRALLAGKDVFVEKPLALSAEAGEKLVALSEEKGRILMVGHLLWYHPGFLKLKEIVDSGRLGRILYIYSNRLNLGKIRVEEDILWSFAPHDISIILGVLGETPHSVTAQGGNYLNNDIADVTISTMVFPSGARAHVFVSWLHPFKEQRLVVIGDRAMARFSDSASSAKLVLFEHSVTWDNGTPVPDKGDVTAIPFDDDEPLRLECEHFIDCVRTRRRPRTDGQEGVRVLRVLNQCQEALQNDERS